MEALEADTEFSAAKSERRIQESSALMSIGHTNESGENSYRLIDC